MERPPPQVGSLDYVLLYAPDVEAAVRFYATILGAAAIEESYPHWARVRLGNIDVGLHLAEEGATPGPGGQPVFRVSDLAAMRVHLDAEGVEMGAVHDIPGGATFDFRDVAGNTLGVLQWGTSAREVQGG